MTPDDAREHVEAFLDRRQPPLVDGDLVRMAAGVESEVSEAVDELVRAFDERGQCGIDRGQVGALRGRRRETVGS